jgi:ADP-dependent NAD(P)H-hydrate dehydratase / NAD(P)H-hydrate epimerase
MTQLLTTAQMRAIEGAAFAGGTDSRALMERAGAEVVAAILARWPGPMRAAVLCGPGNNGGDGFVVARLLSARGWPVVVHLFGRADRLPQDARTNHDRWASAHPVFALRDFRPEAADLIVDALFGIGMTRPMAPTEALDSLAATDLPLVAIDLPSGLDADTGVVRPPGLRAALTVTFHRAKLGHYLAAGPDHCGELVVADIGLSEVPGASVRLVGAPATGALDKGPAAHKYGHGHALVLSGGVGRGGAARLAARAALRIGAGLVTLACPPAALIENAARLDAIMLRAVKDAAGLGEILMDPRITALCLGPGLGLGRARDLVPAALAARRATVLDADALTAFSEAPEALFAALHPACLLTPHAGEFARLFPDLDLADPVRAMRAAADRAGCAVLLKGRTTLIAAPDGSVALHAAAYGRGAPWLATAGAGDVLAGFAAGLMARGWAPQTAAAMAAWLHVEAARAFGPGLIAEDLPEALPIILRRSSS